MSRLSLQIKNIGGFHRDIWDGLVSVITILISIAFESQLLLVLGGLGLFMYLSYLAQRVFKNSLLFPFALAIIGLGLMFTGVQYQLYHDQLRAMLYSMLPQNSLYQSFMGSDAYSILAALKGYALAAVRIMATGISYLGHQETYVIYCSLGVLFLFIALNRMRLEYNRSKRF